jgi:hypothetical protein
MIGAAMAAANAFKTLDGIFEVSFRIGIVWSECGYQDRICAHQRNLPAERLARSVPRTTPPNLESA